jgi:hypothetical protein
MTRAEAEKILADVGCIDPKNLACAHIAYARWIDLYGRGIVPWKPVADAFMRVKQIDTAQEQLQMFVEKGADL